MTSKSKYLIAAINHLLTREAWARERLSPYAGRLIRIVMPLFTMVITVQPDGYFMLVNKSNKTNKMEEMGEQSFDVSLIFSSQALWQLLMQRFATGTQGMQITQQKHIKVEGDAEFAATLALLARHLRWEPDEDLARFIGDAPAYRIMQTLRNIRAQARRTTSNLLQTIADYWLEENPQLVRKKALVDFNTAVAQLRDDAARLEKRLTQLTINPPCAAQCRA